MRHFGIWAAFAALVLSGSSCNRFLKDGDWDPIKMDKSEVHFTSNGGEETVTSLNYGSWWINGGYEDFQIVNGQGQYVNYVMAGSTDGQEAYTYDILDGGWYHASVPEKGRSNKLIITVDQNYTAKPRQATIDMEAGDAFTSVKIYQN